MFSDLNQFLNMKQKAVISCIKAILVLEKVNLGVPTILLQIGIYENILQQAVWL